MINIILASSSPRRKELMKLLDLPFRVIVKEIEECIDFQLSPQENVKSLAYKKAMAVSADYEEDLIIGCDTLVSLEGKIIGKPKDTQDAKYILQSLSGKVHQVSTGVVIICKKHNIEISLCETTQVKMTHLTEQEIDDYTATGEPMDKAGAYGIQGKGAKYIESITGDYYSVMGLPVHKLYKELLQLNSY